MRYERNRIELKENGYSILADLYSDEEINQILICLESNKKDNDAFLKTKDLFAIRQLIKNVPELAQLLFTQKMIELISELSESKYFLSKAIYFDKPSQSNWFVAYHQDLSISVDQKLELENYSNWTFKKGQYGVQPPKKILEDTITIRIHLDATNEHNGALKVIPKSHINGITRFNPENWNQENEFICEVKKGGVMLMNPLTLHASNRTTNGKKRRVIHLEFNKHLLAKPLNWLEYYELDTSNNSVQTIM